MMINHDSIVRIRISHVLIVAGRYIVCVIGQFR